MKKGIVNTAVVIICLITLIIVIWDKFGGAPVKYVEIKKIYDGFEMKKEYEDKFKKVQGMRSKIMDSLEMELKIMDQQIGISNGADKELIAKFQVKRDVFLEKKQKFNEDDAATVQDYDAKILKQLNQYIEDYGKETNCEYILGYTGNGEVLYGRPENNITDEIVKYVNSKYNGQAK
ncbi:MAG: OmpH family outer membrane protein [Bacteroidota bacterium]|nr:OmpH family outer membrane protein [Bacteroidota bacterium]